MTTVQIDPPAPIPSDSAVLCALRCWVARYGGGDDGLRVGSYFADERPHAERMSAAWCYWIAATKGSDRNPATALLAWHDRQALLDAVTEWQRKLTDRDLSRVELPDPATAEAQAQAFLDELRAADPAPVPAKTSARKRRPAK